jgi:hypothetical protein
MTVTADNKKRVVLPSAKPGDRFDLVKSDKATFVLRRLEPIQARQASLVKPVRYKDGWVIPCELDIEKLTEEIRQERERRDEDLLG